MTNSGLEKFMQWFQKSNPQAAKQMQQNLTQNKPGMQNQMGMGVPQMGGQNPMGQQNPGWLQQQIMQDQSIRPQQQMGGQMQQNPGQMQQNIMQNQSIQPQQRQTPSMMGGLTMEGNAYSPDRAMLEYRQSGARMPRGMQPPMGIQDDGDLAGLLRNRGGNVPNMMQFGMG